MISTRHPFPTVRTPAPYDHTSHFGRVVRSRPALSASFVDWEKMGFESLPDPLPTTLVADLVRVACPTPPPLARPAELKDSTQSAAATGFAKIAPLETSTFWDSVVPLAVSSVLCAIVATALVVW